MLLNEAVNNYFQENCCAVSVRQSIVKNNSILSTSLVNHL